MANPHSSPHPSAERLHAFAEGLVTEVEEDLIESHLVECSDCCTRLEEIPDDHFVSCLRSAAQSQDAQAELAGPSSESSWPAISGYEILAELGRGGMGVVYKARQIGLNRLVAVKMLLAGAQASPRDQARFRQEAETIASLSHPGIIQIHDVGVCRGTPYFAMEWIEGGSLADLLKEGPLQPREAATLVERLAAAVQAAHERGIVHRDLKPANILLSGDKLAARGDLALASHPAPFEPKVSDFGLARWLHADLHLTQTGVTGGTPAYMAPEQVSAGAISSGTPVDVYALGVILYELLTGRPPFLGRTSLETIQQVCTAEPASPRRFNPRIPSDLATVCLKCLEKPTNRRYRSAAELGADLHRFLQGRPVFARPVSEFARGAFWIRRNPAVAALLLGIAFCLIAGTAVSTYFSIKAGRRAVDAELAADRELNMRRAADLRLYAARMAMAQHAWADCDIKGAQELLDACIPHPGEPDLLGWEWHYVHSLCHAESMRLSGHDGPVFGVAYSPNGKYLASAGGGNLYFRTKGGIQPGQVIVRDAISGDVLHRLKNFEHLTTVLAFSPDSRLLAAGSFDGSIALFDLAAGKEIARLRKAGHRVTGLSFNGAGTHLMSVAGVVREGGQPTGIELWDLKSSRSIGPFATGEQIRSAQLSPDGKRVYYNALSQLRCIDLPSGAIVWRSDDQREEINVLALDPAGETVASATRAGRIKLVGAKDGKLERSLGSQVGVVRDLRFSPDGRTLASTGDRPEVRLWDTSTGEIVRVVRGPSSIVEAVAFAPDGSRLATGEHDGFVKTWAIRDDQRGLLHSFEKFGGRSELRFNDDGTRLLESLTVGWELHSIDTRTGYTDRRLMKSPQMPQGAYVLASSPNGRWLAGATYSKGDDLCLWDTKTRQHRVLTVNRNYPSSLSFSSDSKRLVVACAEPPNRGDWESNGAGRYTRRVFVWDVDQGKVLMSIPAGERDHDKRPRLEHGDCLALDRDGRWIAHAGYYDRIRIFRPDSPEMMREIDNAGGWCRSLTFSDDGRLLAGQFIDRSLVVWNTADWSERCRMNLATKECALALSPDGKRLASTDMWGTIRLWETDTGIPVFVLRGLGSAFGTMGIRAQVAFDSTGMRLASFNNDNSTNIYDATPRPVIVPPEL